MVWQHCNKFSSSVIANPTSLSALEAATSRLQRLTKSGSLEISLGHTAKTLLASLEANPSLAERVRDVVVQHGERSSPPLSLEELTDLFATLGRVFSRTESLRVALDISGNQQSTFVALPVAALTAFFEEAPQSLVSLKISAVISASSEQDFERLEDTIRLQAPKSWKEIRLEFCEPTPGTTSLDPLLRAFSACPSLQQVILSGTNITQSCFCTGPSLAKLVQGTDLKVLTVWGGKRLLSAEDVLALLEALEAKPGLKELTLHARGLCPMIGQALARYLSSNKTLERLILSVSDNHQHYATARTPLDSEYVVTTTALSNALRLHNRTLRMLSLDYSPEDDVLLTTGDSHDYDFYEYDLIDAAKAVMWRSSFQEVIKSFTDMLHKNPVLEVLWMNLDNDDEDEDGEGEEERCGSTLTGEMEMLLRLNRYGIRRSLFEGPAQASSEEWLKALISHKDDLSILHYLLSRNPAICSSVVLPHRRKRDEPPPSEDDHMGVNKRRRVSSKWNSGPYDVNRPMVA